VYTVPLTFLKKPYYNCGVIEKVRLLFFVAGSVSVDGRSGRNQVSSIRHTSGAGKHKSVHQN